MAPQTKCPDCQNEFLVKNNLKYRLQPKFTFIKLALRNIAFPWLDGLEEIYKANLVVCPQCGNEFSAAGYKYFGFIEVKHFQIGLVVVILSFIFLFLAGLIWSVLR